MTAPGVVGLESSLVPARMINQFVYCSRLGYLEWVQGEFAHNYFTEDGSRVHRRVDQVGGSRGSSGEDGEAEKPEVARSLWLSSGKLGITAKLDLVEFESVTKRAIPIEYKRGAPPAAQGGAHPSDCAQVCAQVLLLRDQGYDCPHGEIYFAQAKRRVVIEISPELIAKTLAAAARLRELANSKRLPAPTEETYKCDGCSLVGICLPDEVRFLTNKPNERSSEGLRRLHPARDDDTPVILQAKGGRLSLRGEELLAKTTAGEATARLPSTSHVSVFGNIQVTTPTIKALLRADIPLQFFSYGGWYLGGTRSLGSKNVELRVAQFREFADTSRCLQLARITILSKLRNCRTLLRRNHREKPTQTMAELRRLGKLALEAETLQQLLGYEGQGAKLHFQSYGQLFQQSEPGAGGEFDMQGRNRRPPRDPINALLSLGYALLVKECTLALERAGFDPLLGFMHQPRHGKPALSLDLMEPFRPLIVDSTVLTSVRTGVIKPGDFIKREQACALRPAARKRFILAFERRMDQLVTHPVFGYRISYRRVLEVQARLLGRVLMGELDTWPPFETR